ncbi:Protein transport protein S9 plasma membrane t-SNARE [Mortierella alpina]|nr:Protein transport protein S9 plasma membrane t-SNARE [Mortierella alpina]
MADSSEIEAFIAEKLAGISLQDEAITEYFARLVEEESMEEPEKREAITELLADVTEEPTMTVIDTVFEFWNGLKAEEAKKAEEEKEKLLAVAKEKERASLKAQLEDTSNREGTLSMSSRHVIKNMTKEERKKRDALLAQYGYDLDEMVEGADGEMEIIYKDRSKGSGAASGVSTADPLLMANNNAEIVKQKDAIRRAEMKKASENEKERNKLALEKQRLAQEKEKRRTQKSEKRRINNAGYGGNSNNAGYGANRPNGSGYGGNSSGGYGGNSYGGSNSYGSSNSNGSSYGQQSGGYGGAQRPGQSYGQQHQYGGQHNQQPQQQYGGQQGYGNNARPGQYGQPSQYGGQYGGQQQQSYQNYNQYGDQQHPVHGQETEQDVDRVAQQIRDTRQESVQSTRNALRALQEADESAGRTMQQLGEQSEQLGRVERNLDSAQIHADNAQEKAGELKTVNRSMFAVHIKNPFTSTKKKERALEEAKLKAAEELAQRERIRKEEYETKQRLNAAQGQGPYGRGPSSNGYSNNGRGGPGERSAYAFENTAEDDAHEAEIDHNLDMMGGILGNLKNSAMAMNTEVNRQNERMTHITHKTDDLSGSVTHNTQLLQKIAKRG